MKYTAYIYLLMFLTAPLIGSEERAQFVMQRSRPQEAALCRMFSNLLDKFGILAVPTPAQLIYAGQVLRHIHSRGTHLSNPSKSTPKPQKELKKLAAQTASYLQTTTNNSQSDQPNSALTITQAISSLETKQDAAQEVKTKMAADDDDWTLNAINEYIYHDSSCLRTADWLVERLTNYSCKTSTDVFINTRLHGNKPLADHEWYGHLKNSKFRKLDKLTISNTVLDELQKPATQPMHKLFHIVCGYFTDYFTDYCLHAFVIEKKSDGKTTWWRIYQSWDELFTLTGWLNSTKWNGWYKNDDQQELITPAKKVMEQFGNGKKLDVDQITEFLHKPFWHNYPFWGGGIYGDGIYNDGDRNDYLISMFDLAPYHPSQQQQSSTVAS